VNYYVLVALLGLLSEICVFSIIFIGVSETRISLNSLVNHHFLLWPFYIDGILDGPFIIYLLIYIHWFT